MATRCKTVEFVFPTEQATLAAGTTRNLATLDIHLPESGKVFRSVTLEMGCTDEISTSSSATSFTLELALLPANPDTVTIADKIVTTGESSVYHLSRDLTDYFGANWSGESMSVRVGIAVEENATNNHWAKLRITYDYDEEQSPRQIKTIWYPIESTQALLTGTYQPLGGADAIPAIKGGASILPEHHVTVRQVWVELIANQATTDTTDFSLDLRLGTDPTEQLTLYRVEASLATPGWLHAVWDLTGSDLARPQNLEAKLSGATNRVAQICGWVGITYEFAPVGTTLVWNSLMLPAFDGEDQHGSTTSDRKTLHVRELWVQEPATISLQPSQVFAFYDDNALGSTLSLWVGDQAPRAFATAALGAPMVVGQRMDAGGTSGAGLSLTRGRNRIKVHQFGDNADARAVSAVNGFMIVNYTSGLSPAGIGAHNQTRHFALGWFDGDSTQLEYSVGANNSRTPAIPEPRYFLNAVGLQAAWIAAGATLQTLRVQAQRTGDEGVSRDGAGWAHAYRGAIASAAENWLRWTTADCTALFRRWTGDPQLARMDIEADRRWMVLDATGVWVGLVGLLVTYHAIAKTARGTVSGFSSEDGSGLLVNVSRDATGQKLLEVTTRTGGVYEAAWYDDTEALIADVYEDDTRVGRSAPFYASGLYSPPPDSQESMPGSHASMHKDGGTDPIRLDELAPPEDTTTLDATTTRHGLLPKLDGDGAHVLSGLGTWVDGAPMDVQVYDEAGAFTWTKPTTFTPRWVRVICIGGGGGGGGGGDNSSSNARTGGCGGGGGAYSSVTLPASLFAATVDGQVGAGGNGGNGGTSNGSTGSTGGASYFGSSSAPYVYAGGGGGGRYGTWSATAGQGGGGGGRGSNGSLGGSSLNSNEGGPGRSVLDSSSLAASGGTGCRGGFDSSYAVTAEFGGAGGGGRSSTLSQAGGSSMHGGGGGGAGGSFNAALISPGSGGASGKGVWGIGGSAGTSGSSPTAGSAGNDGDGILLSGAGGGGGGASNSGSPTNGAQGGTGGLPGGGGGGGGAGANSMGGDGGDGGRGEVRIYTW